MPLLAPATTYAGVFSFFSDLIDNKEANASVVSSSQVTGVLEAKVGPGSVDSTGGGEIALAGGSALIQESGVNGTQADLSPAQKSTRISLYVVRQGDSLSQIADMFGVSVNTIIWANNIKNGIKEGDELVILPVTGVSHKVAKGDTLRSIASKYKADMDEIRSYNDLDVDGVLAVGSMIIIPDGEMAKAPAASSSSDKVKSASGPTYKDYYLRPIVGGVKSQNLHGYNAVDLAAPIGTPIYASAPGVVIVARSSGYNGGYGAYVVISHPNGTQTLYGHASKILVEAGQTVERGDTIALLGSTGKSTGPHVHFEIRGATNPF